MSSNKFEHTAAIFELSGALPGKAPARFDYGGLVRVSDQNTYASAPEFHVWRAQLEAHPEAAADPRRFCCKAMCASCAGGPPCTIVIKPLAPGDKHIAIGTDVSLVDVTMGGAPATRRTELHFAKNGNQRIPIFASDENLSQQLSVWHREAFGETRQVVYHVYKLVQPVTGDDKLMALSKRLNGSLIAIPIEPCMDEPPAS